MGAPGIGEEGGGAAELDPIDEVRLLIAEDVHRHLASDQADPGLQGDVDRSPIEATFLDLNIDYIIEVATAIIPGTQAKRSAIGIEIAGLPVGET